MEIKIAVLGIICVFALFAFKLNEKNTEVQQPSQLQYSVLPQTTEEPKKEEPKATEPTFINVKPLSQPNTSLGKVLSDIDSHLQAGHIYRDSDKVTWGHETTHGINSRIRNEAGGNVNGFYVLENRGVVIPEPNTTVSAVAKVVPQSLRGMSYNLYLVQQAGSWNSRPLYIFDEWTAYTNGSEVRLDLKIQSRAETVQQMLEFDSYAMCVAMVTNCQEPQFKNYLTWNLERSMRLYKDSQSLGNSSKSDDLLQKLRIASDADHLRVFARNYFGKDWCQKIFGF